MLFDGPASRVEKILALKPLCGKRWSSVFIRWRSKSLFRALVSPPVMKNETKSMIGITKLICCFPKWADTIRRQTSFFYKRAQKDCWQPKKLRYMILHDHKITWAKICCCNSCTKLQRSMPHPRFPRFHFDSQKDDCFNFVESMWYGRSWPRRA